VEGWKPLQRGLYIHRTASVRAMAEAEPPRRETVPVRGYLITGIELWMGDVTLYGSEVEGAGRLRLGWGGAVQVTRPDGSMHTVRPGGRWQTKSDLLGLQEATIDSLTVDEFSNLALITSDGWRIDIAPDRDGEAWEVDGPGEWGKLVAPPGGTPKSAVPRPQP
jgi:hypothetical protein